MHRTGPPPLPPALAATLRVAAARQRLGLLTRPEHEDLAHAVLDAGVYSAGMAELAGFAPHVPSDPGGVFAEGLTELGLVVPDRAEAVMALLRHYMAEIASEQRSGYAVMDEIWRDLDEEVWQRGAPLPAEVHHDLERFIDAYYKLEHYDCCKYQWEMDRLEEQMVGMALGWLWKHGAP